MNNSFPIPARKIASAPSFVLCVSPNLHSAVFVARHEFMQNVCCNNVDSNAEKHFMNMENVGNVKLIHLFGVVLNDLQ